MKEMNTIFACVLGAFLVLGCGRGTSHSKQSLLAAASAPGDAAQSGELDVAVSTQSTLCTAGHSWAESYSYATYDPALVWYYNSFQCPDGVKTTPEEVNAETLEASYTKTITSCSIIYPPNKYTNFGRYQLVHTTTVYKMQLGTCEVPNQSTAGPSGGLLTPGNTSASTTFTLNATDNWGNTATHVYVAQTYRDHAVAALKASGPWQCSSPSSTVTNCYGGSGSSLTGIPTAGEPFALTAIDSCGASSTYPFSTQAEFAQAAKGFVGHWQCGSPDKGSDGITTETCRWDSPINCL